MVKPQNHANYHQNYLRRLAEAAEWRGELL